MTKILSEREKKVLAAVELDADVSIPKIAKATGLREHAARYALEKLLEDGMLQRLPLLSTAVLGFQEYLVYFSLNSPKHADRKTIERFLIQATPVKWLAKLVGEYQYGMVVIASSPQRAFQFLSQLSEKFKDMFSDKAVSAVVNFAIFGRKYLSKSKLPNQYISLGDSEVRVRLDQSDHRILSALETLPQASVSELARHVKMAITTVDYRIKSLQKNGVIKRFRYHIVKGLLHPYHVRILVFAKGYDNSVRERIFSFALQHPNIVFFQHLLGRWDYELHSEHDEPGGVMSVAEELQDLFGAQIQRVQCISMFDTLKSRGYVFANVPKVEDLSQY